MTTMDLVSTPTHLDIADQRPFRPHDNPTCGRYTLGQLSFMIVSITTERRWLAYLPAAVDTYPK